tara:strand:+ start:1669 stop:1869 length:201 start_codon:yes stop_codon:yes gene_type:complete
MLSRIYRKVIMTSKLDDIEIKLNDIVLILEGIKNTMQNMGELDKAIVGKLMDLDSVISNVYDTDTL